MLYYTILYMEQAFDMLNYEQRDLPVQFLHNGQYSD